MNIYRPDPCAGTFVVEYYTKVEAAHKMVEKGEWTEQDIIHYDVVFPNGQFCDPKIR
jgi:hypothetical protein